jgi:hypothetical protein
MRRLFVGAAVLWLLCASPAGATTFNLRFQSSGGVCTAGSTSCVADPGEVIRIDLVITLSADRMDTSTSVGFDLSAMFLPVSAVTATAFEPAFGTAVSLNGDATPVGSTVAAEATADASCIAKLAGCDARFSSFGYQSPSPVGSGVTYTAGTITLDLGQYNGGANPYELGTFTIATYRSLGVDVPLDNSANPHNSAILSFPVLIPEPSTGLLLGAGLLGLLGASRAARA